MSTSPTVYPNPVQFQGEVRIAPGLAREQLRREFSKEFPIQLTEFRVWDAFQTALGTAANDDLGITAGTFGTGCPYLSAGDLKGAGATTRYARALVMIPVEYESTKGFVIRLSAGMLTTVSDTTATVDVEAYRVNRDTLKTGSDLVTTAATSINSLTFADTDFALTATDLAPGEWLDIRIAVAVNDAATGTVVEAAIAAAEIIMTIRG